MIGAITAGLFSAGTPPVTNSYESIATFTVPLTAQANITFSSIPATFKHLQIRGIARTSTATGIGGFSIQLNGDTGANYAVHLLQGDGASAVAAAQTSTSDPYPAVAPGATAGANIFGAMVFDVLDYANTNKYKTIRALAGGDLNGSGQLRFGSTLWQNTAATTSIKLYDLNGGNLVQYSSFALYGIKG